jgi:hypothetical protein
MFGGVVLIASTELVSNLYAAISLCWVDTQQSLDALFPLRDAQSLSCRGIDLAGYRQVIA